MFETGVHHQRASDQQAVSLLMLRGPSGIGLFAPNAGRGPRNTPYCLMRVHLEMFWLNLAMVDPLWMVHAGSSAPSRPHVLGAPPRHDLSRLGGSPPATRRK